MVVTQTHTAAAEVAAVVAATTQAQMVALVSRVTQ
jgi:hypothetical protein